MRRKLIVALLVIQFVLISVPRISIIPDGNAAAVPNLSESQNLSFENACDYSQYLDNTENDVSTERAVARVAEFDAIEWERIDCSSSSGILPSNEAEQQATIQPSSEPILSTNGTEVISPITIEGDYIPLTNAKSSVLSTSDTCNNGGDSYEGVYCDDTSFYPWDMVIDHPAPELSPAKDAHWFIKQSYSVLAFQFDNPNWDAVGFYLDINRDQDIYSRYLTIYLNGAQTHQYVIGSGGFHGIVDFSMLLPGLYKAEIAINYCGWKDHQWKMTYIQPFVQVEMTSPRPIYDFWEYFPHGSYPALEWKVQAGSNTYIHLDTVVMSGPWYYIELYINGQLLYYLSPGSHEISLGDYTTDSAITVKLRIEASSNTYYGTKINYMAVSHRVVTLEIDYMVDQNQNPVVPIADISSMASYVRSYYILHGYARPEYLVDDQIPWDETTTWSQEFIQTYNSYCNHKYNNAYEWVFVANRGAGNYSDAWGFHVPHDWPNWGYGIAIFTYYCNTLDRLKTVFMHEFGHHAGILDTWPDGSERYCGDIFCCMATADFSVSPNPWYCIFHWSLRDYPYTPQD